jgi:hypothetical protein
MADKRIDMEHGWEGKSDRLPTSGLGDSHDVAAAQGHWPGLALNWSGGGEPLGADGCHEVFGEAALVERGDGSRYASSLCLVYGSESGTWQGIFIHLYLLLALELFDLLI